MSSMRALRHNGIFPEATSEKALFYYITDRRSLTAQNEASLLRRVRKIISRGVDFVQIREKDLSDRRLLELTRRIVEMAREVPRTVRCRILVNGRADIAAAAGADGVHLASSDLGILDMRDWIPKKFIVGASVHTMREIRAACARGVDYVLVGHVFPTVSKEGMGAALGVGFLRRACIEASVPVFALGGITAERIHAVMQAGAVGVAGISLFQNDDGFGIFRGFLRQPLKIPKSRLATEPKAEFT